VSDEVSCLVNLLQRLVELGRAGHRVHRGAKSLKLLEGLLKVAKLLFDLQLEGSVQGECNSSIDD